MFDKDETVIRKALIVNDVSIPMQVVEVVAPVEKVSKGSNIDCHIIYLEN